MHQQLAFLATLVLSLSLTMVFADPFAPRQITVVNNCPFTVWPASFTAGSHAGDPAGWEAKPNTSLIFSTPATWGRRLCNFSKGPNNCFCLAKSEEILFTRRISKMTGISENSVIVIFFKSLDRFVDVHWNEFASAALGSDARLITAKLGAPEYGGKDMTGHSRSEQSRLPKRQNLEKLQVIQTNDVTWRDFVVKSTVLLKLHMEHSSSQITERKPPIRCPLRRVSDFKLQSPVSSSRMEPMPTSLHVNHLVKPSKLQVQELSILLFKAVKILFNSSASDPQDNHPTRSRESNAFDSAFKSRARDAEHGVECHITGTASAALRRPSLRICRCGKEDDDDMGNIGLVISCFS
ncbi:hypothetical protein R3P38DRAFT_3378604 [Favolaschia claudopus]|uniref:Uncharacterized protein n=1 Tax=Favolaschia claudopus TaxID=2862362 RepID=A0AAV9Z8E3_9AGAR